MKERYFDLNGRENCVAAIISIADRQFRISRVVIGARNIYSNHLSRMGELLQQAGSIDESNPDDFKEMLRKTEDFQKEKSITYEKVLKLILEKNGYEYDKTWWEENTDEPDQRTFIESCMLKDSGGNKKKEAPNT